MKRIVGMVLIFLIFIYITVYLTFLSIPVADVFNETVPVSAPVKSNYLEMGLFDFISNKLSKNNGEIITNIKNYKGSKDTLSESVGLFMNYCVISNRKELFDREVGFLKNKMLADKGFIKWVVGSGDTYCNASIDDCRIVRALMDAYDRWGDKEYYNLAGTLQLNIYKYQVRDQRLCEFYDWNIDKTKNGTLLCYLDLYTIYRMSEFNENWLAVEDESCFMISNGRINDSSPFFYKYYDYETGRYSLDEEYGNGKGICITYTLYTAIHLAEVNEDTQFLTDWLEKQVSKGTLYAWYDPYTLKPANDLKSTAVYALAAVYAEKAGEKELCRQITNEMLELMVSDRKSNYFGGFGDPNTGNFYSFDNLTALWALYISGDG